MAGPGMVHLDVKQTQNEPSSSYDFGNLVAAMTRYGTIRQGRGVVKWGTTLFKDLKTSSRDKGVPNH